MECVGVDRGSYAGKLRTSSFTPSFPPAVALTCVPPPHPAFPYPLQVPSDADVYGGAQAISQPEKVNLHDGAISSVKGCRGSICSIQAPRVPPQPGCRVHAGDAVKLCSALHALCICCKPIKRRMLHVKLPPPSRLYLPRFPRPGC